MHREFQGIEHLPEGADLDITSKFLEDRQATGAGRDHRRIAQPLELGPEALHGLGKQLLFSSPMGRNAAAAEHQADTALQLTGQVLVGAFDCFRGGSGQLAAGIEDISAACGPRLMAAEDTKGAEAEAHVFQGEIMGRRRHLAAAHHLLAGSAADIGHREIMGADSSALAA